MLQQLCPTPDGMEAAAQNTQQPSPNPRLNVRDLYLHNGASLLSEYVICGAHPAGMSVRIGAPGPLAEIKLTLHIPLKQISRDTEEHRRASGLPLNRCRCEILFHREQEEHNGRRSAPPFCLFPQQPPVSAED